MIAHRLQTIETAENLLYLDEPHRVLAGGKGTVEYEEIMTRLKKTNYAHQNEEDEKDGDDKNKGIIKRMNTQKSLIS